MSFDNSFELLKKQEGEYSNNEKDLGGETYIGISRVNHPDIEMWPIIDEVKKTTLNIFSINMILRDNNYLQVFIYNFYKKNYWDVLKLDEITDSKISEFIFLCHVNMGSIIVKFFQKVLNALNYCNETGSRLFTPDIACDTIMTNYEIECYNNIIKNKKLVTKSINVDILDRLKAYVLVFYTDISVSRYENRIFTDGWNRKIMEF